MLASGPEPQALAHRQFGGGAGHPVGSQQIGIGDAVPVTIANIFRKYQSAWRPFLLRGAFPRLLADAAALFKLDDLEPAFADFSYAALHRGKGHFELGDL